MRIVAEFSCYHRRSLIEILRYTHFTLIMVQHWLKKSKNLQISCSEKNCLGLEYLLKLTNSKLPSIDKRKSLWIQNVALRKKN